MSDTRQTNVFLIIVAAALVFGGFYFHGDIGLNIADEGFLWDGVRRTALGEVPIRDFNAYDPGRYYWCAVGSHFFGDGLIALRISTSFFRLLGLYFGLLAARRVVHRLPGLVAVGVLLWWWNPTYYKTFETTAAFAAVYFGVRLIENPSNRIHFVAGVTAGIVAVFGRNLGLYTVVAHACIIGYLQFKHLVDTPLPRRLVAWILGIVVGNSPLLLVLAFMPSFASAFAESLAFHFQLGQTNLPLPVPWPWALSTTESRLENLVALAVGVGFLTLAAFCILGALSVVFLSGHKVRENALFVSSVFSALTFGHHAFARADYEHLAHVIPPLLLGFVAVLSALVSPGVARSRIPFIARYASAAIAIVLLALVTFIATLPYNFPVQYYEKLGAHWTYEKTAIGGDSLWLPKWQVDAIRMFDGVIARYSKPGDRFVIGPYEAGLYSVFGQTCPIWNAYMVYPETTSRQERMITELREKEVGLILVNDAAAVDGNPLYRFRNSHPLLWQHLWDAYRIVREDGLPPGWLVFIKR
jgi:hypothetical protein